MEAFVPQIPALEAIATSDAIIEKCTVTAFLRTNGADAVIAIIGVQRFVTQFTIDELVAITEISRTENPF